MAIINDLLNIIVNYYQPKFVKFIDYHLLDLNKTNRNMKKSKPTTDKYNGKIYENVITHLRVLEKKMGQSAISSWVDKDISTWDTSTFIHAILRILNKFNL